MVIESVVDLKKKMNMGLRIKETDIKSSSVVFAMLSES